MPAPGGGDRGSSTPTVPSATPAEQSPLIRAILESTTDSQTRLVTAYCSLASALHFLYRTDVPVGATGGRLTQTLSPSLQFPFVDQAGKSRVWSAYQKLVLRLRTGSALTTPANTGRNIKGTVDSFPTEAQDLYGDPPEGANATYLVDGGEIYVGMNGPGFEIYAVLPSTVPPKEALGRCVRLVRKLREDAGTLFLSNPPTFND